MTDHGILVVQPNWHEGQPLAIDKTTYQHHQDTFRAGTRMLLYMKEPTDAIIGEAEVTAEPVHPDADPNSPIASAAGPLAHDSTAPAPGGIDQRAFEIPYTMAHLKAQTTPIALNRIHTRIGSDFSVFDEEWIPLTETQYQALIEEWERSAS